jgi:hypothetical protein
LTTATFAIDQALGGNRAIQIIGCILAVGVVLTWFFVFGMMIRAVLLRQILWPQRQEDRNEGGWVEGDERMSSVDRDRQVRFRTASAMQRKMKQREKADQIKKDSDDTAVTHSRDSGMERILSHDRADYAIKEAQKKGGNSPSRGRRPNSGNQASTVDNPSRDRL